MGFFAVDPMAPTDALIEDIARLEAIDAPNSYEAAALEELRQEVARRNGAPGPILPRTPPS
jgi:hypothetical protein